MEGVIARAQLAPGERVLDLGTGTGAVAERAAEHVGPEGLVVGVDISADMLHVAQEQLAGAGIEAEVERETLGFDFGDSERGGPRLPGVTSANLSPKRRQEAQAAVMSAMYPRGDGPRHFRNTTQFIAGRRG